MDERRAAKVSEAVREELSEIIGFELNDPRIGGVDVNAVHVSSDMRHAQIKVGIHGGEKDQKAALAALDHASAYLRHELAARLDLGKTPELHFEADPSPQTPERLEILLKRVKKNRGSG
ncbi:MAG: 30S ribosome-binding factor RbfA [Acidobacteriota bacterium]|nr:30S ribosome-binding factor RbfA [Acidobacteriota bacterium]